MLVMVFTFIAIIILLAIIGVILSIIGITLILAYKLNKRKTNIGITLLVIGVSIFITSNYICNKNILTCKNIKIKL